MKLSYLSLTVVTILMLTNCASSGKKFNFENVPNLKLGETKVTQQLEMFGTPVATSLQNTSGGTFEIARYFHAHANLATTKGRVLVLEFKDTLLNAYSYLSSFEEDQTLIDLALAINILKGKSTKSLLLKDLGAPDGMGLCPSVLDDFKKKCESAHSVYLWSGFNRLSTFGSGYGGVKPSSKILSVTFDSDDIVLGYETSVSN